MSEIIENIIILGRSWPEPFRDNRYAVCTVGYSREMGFVRIYPTRISSPLKTWNIVNIEVERNREDSRKESWKIAGSKKDWDYLDSKIKVIGTLGRDDRIDFLRKLPTDRTENLLSEKRSLGLVKPEITGFGLKETGIIPSIQTTLTGIKLKSKKDFPYKPYIQYRCLPECSCKNPHDQQLLEWGVYMWLNEHKSKEDINKVFDNLHIADDLYEKYFLVGNLNFKRKTFAIISVMRFKK